MDCNSIEWLVDILGTIELLHKVINGRRNNYTVESLERGPQKSKFRGTGEFPDGLYFMTGHWYSCRDNVREDSYKLKYQRDGTAHFCQTFAAMIFLGNGIDLRAERYSYNIEKALEFWIDLITEKPTIGTSILNEMKTSKWANKKFEGTDNLLKNATKAQLLNFLEEVKDNAATFVGCTQG